MADNTAPAPFPEEEADESTEIAEATRHAGGPKERAWIVDGSLRTAMWRLAFPTMISTFLQNVFMLADMFWVGKLGKEALAAVGTAGMLLGLAFMVAMGVAIGTAAMISRFIGEKKDAHHVLAQALLLAIVNAIIVSAVGLIFAEDLLRLLKAKEAIIGPGAAYLRIGAVTTFVMYIGLTLNSALRSSGDAVTPVIVLLVANVLNVVLDPFLIFGWWIAPQLGVAGSAVATTISHTIGVAITVTLVFRTDRVNFRLSPRDLWPDWNMIWRILRIGIFGSAQGLVRHISAAFMVRIVLGFGTAAMAAFTLGMRIWFAALMPALGFGMAAATLVGQNLGAGQPNRAAKAGWRAARTYGIFGVAVGAAMVAVPGVFLAPFSESADVLETARHLLRINGATMVFVSLSMVLGRAMHGAGDTRSPLVITAFNFLLVRLPLAYALSAHWNSVSGVWWAMGISSVLQGVTMASWFAVGRWKHKRV